jgi:serine/threonine protein kinase
MNTEPDPVESLFVSALDRPPGERAAYLDEACHGNGALRKRVEALLKSHAAAGGDAFLTGPYAAELSQMRPPQGPGTRIGPYKLLQQLGEGGMGVVWMAEQEQPVRRRVALKIIKPGMDSSQVIARFEAERQALALMDHQNIAHIFDAGTTPSGRPYFVMELVHGVSITRFCDDHRLTPRQRLELFIPVCHAMQHAHQKGIIHRDIKPSNVLVTLYDDQPVPKVIDFGVAKAIEQRLTEKTLFTQFGMLVGTFEYMSPEQAEMNALGVDTRSDIYSLGVLLYELLTGTTPLERPRLRQAALDEVVRLIREEEPPRPSARLSSSGNLPRIAADRRTEPGRLTTLVRGELDWIVMRCLEKNRARRYESASALVRDAERYLHDEPVEACPPSMGYRLRKFVRKNRGSVSAATLVFLAVLGGMIGALAGWRKAEQSATRERQAKEEVQLARNDLEEVLARSLIGPLDPEGGETLNLAEYEALWQLARLENDRVRQRYLEQGLASESTANQLYQRAEWVMRALIGLDSERRAWATAQVMKALGDSEKSAHHRCAIAWLGLEVASRGSTEQRELCEVIRKEWAAEESEQRKTTHRNRLLAMADWLAPPEAARMLVEVLQREEDPSACRKVAECLIVVGGRMESTEAARIYAQAARFFNEHMMREKDFETTRKLAESLVALTVRTEPTEAARFLSGFLDRDSSVPFQTIEGLVSVASRMEPSEGLRLLKDTLSRKKQLDVTWQLTKGLVAVAARLEPAQASQILIEVLRKEKDSNACLIVADGLAWVAGRMKPVEAARVCAQAAQSLNELLQREKDSLARSLLSQGLVALAGRMEPAEAARVCAQATGDLIDDLSRERKSNVLLALANRLLALANRMESTEATRVSARVARSLNQALRWEEDCFVCNKLAKAVAATASRMERAEAAQVCELAARTLKEKLSKRPVANERRNLAEGLVAVTRRLESAQVARICAQAARILGDALAREKDSSEQHDSAEALAVVAGRMKPAAAAQICVQAARILNDALSKEMDAEARDKLADGLATVAGRMEPSEAARVCAQAARSLNDALSREKEAKARWNLATGLIALSYRLKPADADRLLVTAASTLSKVSSEEEREPIYATEQIISAILTVSDGPLATRALSRLAGLVAGSPDANYSPPALEEPETRTRCEALEWTLTNESPAEIRRQAVMQATAVAMTAGNFLPCLSLLPAAFEPLPCRFPTQELVDLLKMPTCVGQVRRVILTQLSNRYGRRFDSHWDFVRYAQGHELNLDFTTPPRRPDRKLPALFTPRGHP